MILDELEEVADSFTKKDIKKLEDDQHYYGAFGRRYLSNSDIGALLGNPKDFRKDKKW